MNYTEIVNKLIGPVEPVGETNTDEHRFKNLQDMCNVAEHLLERIQTVALTVSNGQHSVKKAVDYADTFLQSIRVTD